MSLFWLRLETKSDPCLVWLPFILHMQLTQTNHIIVGGKFDNGGRFDLRLPYADQGYVDEDADAMKKLTNFFGGGKKKAAPKAEPVQEEPPKKNWPW